MHTKHILAAAAALTGPVFTQSTFQNDMSTDTSRSSISASLMNITFSDSNSRSCGNNSDTALTIAIRTLPEHQVCFNLGNTFSFPDSTYSIGKGNKCEENTICGVNYTIIATTEEFDSGLNYSQVAYTQVRNPFAPSSTTTTSNNNDDDDDDEREERRIGGRLEFQVYNGANCQKNDGVASREWNCLSAEGECDTVGFAVQSFSIEMTDPEDVGSGNCSVAKTGGAQRRYGGASGVAAVVSVVVGVVGGLVLL
ncbi:hypothetical protein Slin15195_G040740 [Septoria linicola]|uniref:Uncharacterized protein n=1 Tax=Septoria linicola TaxID=215465 RepID=A0A9Q9AQK3_9PEZI|nr:hypothetical protein Slin14017_G044270 [Septoria linicola]USW50755.1 hypothetical protein Slin15195_G040740 [Septoria linicola]